VGPRTWPLPAPWYDAFVRIAVLADVHGNLPAFEAVLADARAHGPDLLVVAGDVINGAPDSRACWLLARAEADLLLRGNHERYVIDRGTERGDPDWSSPRFQPLAWTASEMEGLEDEVRSCAIAAPLPGLPLEAMHGGPDDDQTQALPWRSDETLLADFAGAAPLVVRGHDHAPADRWLPGGRRIVTAGAVGLPLTGRTEAQWVLLERRAGRAGADGPAAWRVEHRSVAYDVDAALARFVDTGYLRAAGPVARLFRRELATGAHHLVPFMRFEARWRAETGRGDDPASLEAALEAFLHEY
jgi:predicted phosphodiesterase